jgi:hypothetical protein
MATLSRWFACRGALVNVKPDTLIRLSLSKTPQAALSPRSRAAASVCEFDAFDGVWPENPTFMSQVISGTESS